MNLIVTCARHFEGETREELVNILEELGDSSAQITITSLSGVLTAQTKVNPAELIKKIHEKLQDEPWSIRYMLRVIPIFQAVPTDTESITKAALEQIQKIKPTETYRITIEKRNSDISSRELISQIAAKIPNKVSLENYDWIILVEIVGKISGISVLKESEILRIEKAKRESVE
jgi:tRNA acetyltransferase TAN1